MVDQQEDESDKTKWDTWHLDKTKEHPIDGSNDLPTVGDMPPPVLASTPATSNEKLMAEAAMVEKDIPTSLLKWLQAEQLKQQQGLSESMATRESWFREELAKMFQSEGNEKLTGELKTNNSLFLDNCKYLNEPPRDP